MKVIKISIEENGVTETRIIQIKEGKFSGSFGFSTNLGSPIEGHCRLFAILEGVIASTLE